MGEPPLARSNLPPAGFKNRCYPFAAPSCYMSRTAKSDERPALLIENQDEEALVLSAQRGDRDAFAQLYEANVERIYRYLLARLTEPADAEDITTEVFMQAMKSLPSYKSRGTPLIAWLFRIAHNQAVNYIKKRARRKETLLMETAAASDSPEEAVLAKIGLGEVHEAMSALTDLQRQVLSLRFAADLSIAEVARVMNRKEGAVKALQFSALRALRRVWRREEAGSYGPL